MIRIYDGQNVELRAVATFEYRTHPVAGGTGEPGTLIRETPFAWQ